MKNFNLITRRYVRRVALVIAVGLVCGGCGSGGSAAVPDLTEPQQVEKQIAAVRADTKMTPVQKDEQIKIIRAASKAQLEKP